MITFRSTALSGRHIVLPCARSVATVRASLGDHEARIDRIAVIIDRGLNRPVVRDSDMLLINWFIRREPFDYSQVWIVEAGDFDIEELVVILKGDIDKRRRERLASVPGYYHPGCGLSQSKKNLLRASFDKVLAMDKSQCNGVLKMNSGRGRRL